MAETVFIVDKARVLKKADLSRKGSVDEGVRSVVEFINCQPAYYTTSSCSGRVVVFSEVSVCFWCVFDHFVFPCSR